MSKNGIHYFFLGCKFLIKPGIKRYVIIPAIINILLFALFMYTGIHLINHFTIHLPAWLHWLRWLFWLLFFFASAVIMAFSYTIITNLIGAPFNGLLSEKIELMVTGKTPGENTSFWAAIKDIPRSLNREWEKIIYYAPRAIVLIICYLVPVVNLLASFLWFIFGCWMMAVEYVDYPMDNHKIPFEKLHQHLRNNCLASFSFGFIVTIATMIPIVNFIVMPAAVAGGTLMYIDQTESK